MEDLGGMFTDIWKIIQVVIGIGFIILIHEFGHFIVARWCGVRCEVFSIGFGPKIFGWRGKKKVDTGKRDDDGKPIYEIVKGDCEYRLAWIPLGGYVKMAGGEVRSDETKGKPDEFLSKSIPQRFAILVAGVTMNAIAAVILFFIAFSLGVPSAAPRIGSVGSEGTAWAAGLYEGDIVTHINGQEVEDFTDLNVAIAFTDKDEVVKLTVKRRDGNGGYQTLEVPVVAQYNEAMGFPQIGVGAAQAAKVGGIDKSREKALEGKLELNDVITHVNGQELKLGAIPEDGETEDLEHPWPREYRDFYAKMREVTGETVDLTVIRKGAIVEVKDVPLYTNYRGIDIGMDSTPMGPVAAVRPHSGASDAVAAIHVKLDPNTQTNPSESDGDGEPADEGAEDVGADTPTDIPHAWLDPDPANYRAGKAMPMKPGDRIVSINGASFDSYEAMARFIRALPAGEPAIVVIDRPDGDDDEGHATTSHGLLVRPTTAIEPALNYSGSVFGFRMDTALTTAADADADGEGDGSEGDDENESEAIAIDEPDTAEAALLSPMLIRSMDPRGPASRASVSAVLIGDEWVTEAGDDATAAALLGTPIRPGSDVLLKVDGTRVMTWGFNADWRPGTADAQVPGVQNFMIPAAIAGGASSWDGASASASAPLELELLRVLDDETVVRVRVNVTPEAYADNVQSNTIGFIPAQNQVLIKHEGFDAVAKGFDATVRFGAQVFMTIRSIIAGRVHGKNIGGPITIARASYMFAEEGTTKLIYFIALLSVNLAILNILPIPLLDGGHIVFLGVEALRRGKPVPEKVMGAISWIGLILILALIVFVTYNDIANIVNGR